MIEWAPTVRVDTFKLAIQRGVAPIIPAPSTNKFDVPSSVVPSKNDTVPVGRSDGAPVQLTSDRRPIGKPAASDAVELVSVVVVANDGAGVVTVTTRPAEVLGKNEVSPL